MTFVVTGAQEAGVTRARVESLVTFFGGTLRKQVSGKTTYLLAFGHELHDWSATETSKQARGVTESQKYKAAERKGIPILHGLAALLDLIKPTDDVQTGPTQRF